MTAAPRELGNSRLVTVRAPAGGVTAEQGVQIGYLFGIAVEDQPIDGYPVQLALQGTWQLPKKTGEPIMTGEIAYWDAPGRCVTKEAAGNLAIGVTVYDAKDPKDVIDVFLAPSVPVAEAGGAQGFGEAFMTGDPVNIGTINSGQWLNLSQINALVGTPQGIAFTLGDGKFSFSTPGYWKLTVQVIGDGGYLNTVRNMGVRWVNITDGDIVIDETRWVVMTPAINLNVSTTTLIDDDSLGKEFRLQWGDPKEQHGASTTLTSMNIRVESIIADLQGAV